MASNATASPPIACSLDGHDFQERLTWIAALNARALRSHRRDGRRLILTYAPDAIPEVQDMIARERECCAFMSFDLQTTADAVELTIAVPEHAREAADVLLDPFSGSPVHAAACCGSC